MAPVPAALRRLDDEAPGPWRLRRFRRSMARQHNTNVPVIPAKAGIHDAAR
jgi:hypothetical protein